MTEYRRRRFVSVNRVRSQDRRTVIDAICEEGRAWCLAVDPDSASYKWSELRPLPEIEVAERPTAEPSSTAEFISDLVERMGNGSLTAKEALEEFLNRPPVFEPTPTPEPAPAATDEELCRVYNDGPEHGFGPAIRAVYDLGRQHGAAQPPAAHPAPPAAPAGGMVEMVAAAIIEAMVISDRAAACAAIREVADCLEGRGAYSSTHFLREEADHG